MRMISKEFALSFWKSIEIGLYVKIIPQMGL